MTTKKLIAEIKKWVADFEATQPSNVAVDDETFEGGAYHLLQRALRFLEDCKE